VAGRSRIIQNEISRLAPELKTPYILSEISQEEIDRIADSLEKVRCPFLNERNERLIYERRPIACRLEGVPMVDAQDGLFGDWCKLNFTGGIDEEIKKFAQQDYYKIQKAEGDIATIFIPSLIAGFEDYWAGIFDSIKN
jgi:Fe-S-cluster containining protein